jgi:probable F420-dependent oxidoreductase
MGHVKEALPMSLSGIVDTSREGLGAVGVWLGVFEEAAIGKEQSAARRVEELGYGSIWCGERIGGKEAFAHQGVLLAATERIIIGTGIANVWARHPAAMQGGAATLSAAYPGRFVLGVGISHAPMVDRSGLTYMRPLDHMARYLDGMDVASAGPSGVEGPVLRIIGALGPQMLALARDRADGANPCFVPPSHTRLARAALGSNKLLIPEQAVVLNTNPDEARRIAREHMRTYLQLPNYVNNLKRLGYTSEDTSAGGSNRLVDALVAWGKEGDIADRVKEHLDAGADHVLLQPLGDLKAVLQQLETLAPTLIGDR